MDLLFATHNTHKAEEVRAILKEHDIIIHTLADRTFTEDVPETGHTFEANALQKARFIHDRLGCPVVADDSGLEVDALHGAPGVYSKRFSPEATAESNNALLLQRLGDEGSRAARFRCVVALVGWGPDLIVDGSCEGHIASSLLGESGFGYDPLFLPEDAQGRTMAEMTAEEKNAISHRGRAFRALSSALNARRH
jgi:XTP/dITP diphosphohydrolase